MFGALLEVILGSNLVPVEALVGALLRLWLGVCRGVSCEAEKVRTSAAESLFLKSPGIAEVLLAGAWVLPLESTRKLELEQLPCKASTAQGPVNTHRVPRGHGGGYQMRSK